MVCRESRDCLDLATSRHSQAPPHPLCDWEIPLVFDPDRELVYLEIDAGYSLIGHRVWMDDWSPVRHNCYSILACAFPQLYHIKKIAISWHDSHLLDPEYVFTLASKNILWLPAHFPELETVYILDFTIKLRDGCKPDPAAEVFYGHEYTGIEVLSSDTAWSGAGPLRAALEGYQKDYISPSDAPPHQEIQWPIYLDLRWSNGFFGEKDVFICPLYLPSHPRPSFWDENAPRRHVSFKILALVRETDLE